MPCKGMDRHVRLEHGIPPGSSASLPILGVGTYKLKGKHAKNITTATIESGMGLLDTASVYRNEKDIGKSLSSHPRSTHPLIVTKLWRSDMPTSSSSSPEWRRSMTTEDYLMESMERLGLFSSTSTSEDDAVVNLIYIIHWPGPGWNYSTQTRVPIDWTPSTRLKAWNEMLSFIGRGVDGSPTGNLRGIRIKGAGVSNFSIRQLDELEYNAIFSRRPGPYVPVTNLRENPNRRPCLNQIECHPLIYWEQQGLIEYCKRRGIVVQAYGIFGQGFRKRAAVPQGAPDSMIEVSRREAEKEAGNTGREAEENGEETEDADVRLLSHPLLSRIASHYATSPTEHDPPTPAQILLKWAHQHGLAILFGTSHSHTRSRIEENIEYLFGEGSDWRLSEDDMELLDRMGEKDEDRRVWGWKGQKGDEVDPLEE